MLEINLDELRKGLPGFTSIASSYLAEAATYCLNISGHKTGVNLTLEVGDEKKDVIVNWYSALPQDVESTWQDEQELVEYAAVGIALPLVLTLSEYTDVQRARKGSGVDFWLGQKDENGFPILEALLEISGILKKNSRNTVTARLQQKIRQARRSPYKNIPVYIVVIEFSIPMAKLESI